MRNPIVQVLPAGATIAIAVTPPIALEERPYVFTMHGRKSPVAVEIESDASVRVHNPMASAVPFVFFIGPQIAPPQWMAKVMQIISQLRREAPRTS
jgi:hypothetical protein